jgi:hypothetical protein
MEGIMKITWVKGDIKLRVMMTEQELTDILDGFALYADARVDDKRVATLEKFIAMLRDADDGIKYVRMVRT